MITRLSNGGVNAARDCKRKFYYSRELGLQRRGVSVGALNTGKLWHRCLAEWFRTRDATKVARLIEWHGEDNDMVQRCIAMMGGYLAKWAADDLPVMCLSEQQIEVLIRNPATGRRSQRFTQFGFTDMVALHDTGKLWLWEHKSTGQIDGKTIESLWSDSQITGYVAALRDNGLDIEGVVYDLAQKPKLKQKKTEDVDEFYDRIREWHLTKENVYHREYVYISEQQIADWREDIWQVTQEILSCRRTGYWYRNTSRCFDWFRPCDYMPLCQNGASDALINAEYEPRETPAKTGVRKQAF